MQDVKKYNGMKIIKYFMILTILFPQRAINSQRLEKNNDGMNITTAVIPLAINIQNTNNRTSVTSDIILNVSLVLCSPRLLNFIPNNKVNMPQTVVRIFVIFSCLTFSAVIFSILTSLTSKTFSSAASFILPDSST